MEKTLCLPYAEAIRLLIDSGWIEEDGSQPNPNRDLSTKGEQALGRVIREKYSTDYYILGSSGTVFRFGVRYTERPISHLDKMPTEERPFYTMPDEENPVCFHLPGPRKSLI